MPLDSLGARQRPPKRSERPRALARWRARWRALVRFFS